MCQIRPLFSTPCSSCDRSSSVSDHRVLSWCGKGFQDVGLCRIVPRASAKPVADTGRGASLLARLVLRLLAALLSPRFTWLPANDVLAETRPDAPLVLQVQALTFADGNIYICPFNTLQPIKSLKYVETSSRVPMGWWKQKTVSKV